MALRGKKPEAVQKRLKVLVYGPPGAGKTTAAIQFPQPYLIDTERGAENEQYAERLAKSGGVIFQSSDGDEVVEELRSLLSEQHDFRTLIIDPMTVIYDQLLDRAAEEVGTDFGRHKGPANRTIKHMVNLIYRLDMNVIVTSHAKAKWVRSKDHRGKDTVTQEGYTFDCYDKLDYIFDLVLEVERRGRDRIATVRKTRLEAFPEGDEFDFSYDAIAERYGRAHLERDAAAQSLATEEQVSRIRALFEACGVNDETQHKWLDKHRADSLAEVPFDVMARAIEHYSKQAEMAKKGAA